MAGDLFLLWNKLLNTIYYLSTTWKVIAFDSYPSWNFAYWFISCCIQGKYYFLLTLAIFLRHHTQDQKLKCHTAVF